MAQDIANTIKKITHTETIDEIHMPTNTPESFPPTLPEPLTPTPAVYVVSPEPITSTKVKEISNKFKDNNKAYKVDTIENIPRKVNKVEMRYLERSTNASSIENSEKKLSFVSNEDRKKELEDRKAMFEKPSYPTKPLESKISEPKNQKATIQKPNLTTQPSLETKISKPENRKPVLTSKPSLEPKKSELENRKSMVQNQNRTAKPLEAKKSNEHDAVIPKNELNNNVSEKGQPIRRRNSQQIQSQLMDNKKFVTVLSVGGSSSARPALNKTISAPMQPFSTAQNNIPRSKTLPGSQVNPFQDTPQSSMPPVVLPSQQGSIYTSAGKSNFYSSRSNYSSVSMATNVTGPSTESSGTKSDTVCTSATDTGSAYSELTNYSTGVESGVPASRSFDPYSSVDEHTRDVTLAMPQREVTPTNQQAGQVYSFAKDEMRVYTAVDKPRASTKDWNGTTSDAAYESVAVGDVADKVYKFPT